jgi:hypothetical protein
MDMAHGVVLSALYLQITKQQFWGREASISFSKLCAVIYSKSLFWICFTLLQSPQASSPSLDFISRVALPLELFVDFRFIICYCLI